MGRKIIDLTKQRFGRLLVISRCTWVAHNGGAIWNCLCDCGVWTTVEAGNLRRGTTTSCGCYAKERQTAGRIKKLTTHGDSQSITYKSWSTMIQRCYNPNTPKYKYYGGKGIRVDDSWLDSYSMFKADMGERPSIKHCLDRIDPNQNYCQENCRWILKSENIRRQNLSRDSKGRFIKQQIFISRY